MAPGHERCMYCGDSQGAAVDHFEPLSRAPLRAFCWSNHFLACTHCNSNYKRDLFPVDAVSGAPLLVDPTVDNPSEHLSLALSTGHYRPRSGKGQKTIEVFGLQRPVLVEGRVSAFIRTEAMLRDLRARVVAGHEDKAERIADALLLQPFADVLYKVVSIVDAPGALNLVDTETLSGARWLLGAGAVPLRWLA